MYNFSETMEQRMEVNAVWMYKLRGNVRLCMVQFRFTRQRSDNYKKEKTANLRD